MNDANETRAWDLLMDKLDGMDRKLDTVTDMVNRHEVAIEQVKFVGKLAHVIGWPSLAAGMHHLWTTLWPK